MSYIKVDNSEVTVAGMVATDEMIKAGYFECNEIPTVSEDQVLEWDQTNRVLKVKSSATQESIRAKRNQRLLECDALPKLRFLSMTDVELTEWKKYRQDLLDVPQQSGFPFNVVWPNKPGAINTASVQLASPPPLDPNSIISNPTI